MAATVHLGLNPHPWLAANIQGTDALWTVHLVGTHREEVNFHCLHIKGHLAGTLGRINVVEHTGLTADFSNGCNVVDHADFIVGMHHADQHRIGSDRCLDTVGGGQPGLIRVEIGHFEAFALQLSTGIEHRLVFNF